MRTIGIVRARAKIGLQNLAYNIRRLVSEDGLVVCTVPTQAAKKQAGKTIENRTQPNLCPIRRQNRTLFEVPYSCLSLGRRHSE